MKKIFFILACFPLFLGIHVSGDFIFYPGIIFPIVYIYIKKGLSINLIVLLILTSIFALFNSVHWTSLFYYQFGLVYIFNRMQFRKEWIENIFNAIIIICFVTIIFDLLEVKFVDFLTTYKRRLMIDDRSGLTIARPTGFFREPSALGLLLGVVHSVGFLNSLKIRYNLLVISGLLTFSFSFYLMLVFSFYFYSQVRFRMLKTIAILGTIFIIFQNRIYLILDALMSNPNSIVELNLSLVKRYVHPLYAMFEYLRDSTFHNKYLGFGPGGYKLYLQSEYSYIIGSDLRAGYLLNIFGNYLMSFGLIFSVIFLICLKKKYTFKEFLLILLLCFQGVAVVHPVFLIAALKIKK